MTDRDVVVVGGGPAGCSAGVFTARSGLDTVIFDRGASSLDRCAHLSNYLGFPAGIDVETARDLAHEHARRAGCSVAAAVVTAVERDCDGFRVETGADRTVGAARVIAATKYDATYLRPLDEPAMFDGADGLAPDSVAADGTTPVDGLYVAGPIGGAGDQAIIAAGHGATVARALVREARRAEGYRGRFAERYDWLRRAAELEGEWADRDRWREWYDDEAPDDPDAELRERYIDDRLDAYLDEAEIAARRTRAHRALAEHLDPGALLDALDDERIRTYLDGE